MCTRSNGITEYQNNKTARGAFSPLLFRYSDSLLLPLVLRRSGPIPRPHLGRTQDFAVQQVSFFKDIRHRPLRPRTQSQNFMKLRRETPWRRNASPKVPFSGSASSGVPPFKRKSLVISQSPQKLSFFIVFLLSSTPLQAQATHA